MELQNISYNDPKVKRAVELRCGPPFGFWASVRRGGTGTFRFTLWNAPAHILERIDRAEDRRFCSLEVRTQGILVRLRDRLETLAIPLGWADLQHVALEPLPAERMAALVITDVRGERLVFRVPQEHCTSLERLLERSLPPGRYIPMARAGR